MLRTQTVEVVEKSPRHENKDEVRSFYAGLPRLALWALKPSGQSQWFERLPIELGHQMCLGDVRVAQEAATVSAGGRFG
jgi:hypothetical protein